MCSGRRRRRGWKRKDVDPSAQDVRDSKCLSKSCGNMTGKLE